MIPMPPTQFVNWRHMSMLWSTVSTLLRIVAPVAEKPDIDSKKASTGRSSWGFPESMKGIAP